MKWVETGVILTSKNGRKLSPAPKIDLTSDRKTFNSMKRMYSWLREESIKECELAGNEFGASMMRHINVNNITTSDIDIMNDVLFD